ncbi:MAG: hypothetical protein ABH886_00490 [Candidatus Desantisbacteria bacterium]
MWIKQSILIVAGICCLLGNTQLVYATQGETSVEVRLAKIETRLDSLEQMINQRFVAMEKSMDQRFTAMDQRLNDTNNRFGDMMFWLQVTFGAVLMVLAGLAGQWVMMWRRVVQTETVVEEHLKVTEKDRLVNVQIEEIGMLKNLLIDLQQRLTGLEGVVLKTR